LDRYAKVEGKVYPDPNLGLPQEVTALILARNDLIDAHAAADTWAASSLQDASVARAIYRDPDSDENVKMSALGRMATDEVPGALRDLVDANTTMLEAQAASQAMIDEESPERPQLEAGHRSAEVDSASLKGGLRLAYFRLLASYAKWGGFRYYGWTSQKDPLNYYGPVIWSEHDCVHQFAIQLEREFPAAVHTEFKINTAMRSDYVSGKDPMQSIDIVVSDLTGFDEDETSQERFRSRPHEIFVEAKWLKKGRWTKPGELLDRATSPNGGVTKDLKNLKRALEIGRCQAAAVLIFDDECFLDVHDDLIEWPDEVERLIVSPTALKRYGLAGSELDHHLAEIDAQHEERCNLVHDGRRIFSAPEELDVPFD
jgi:hypothetical protein